MNVNQNLRHLPMVAGVIGRSMGVNVVFTNAVSTAGTNGKTIYLPAIACGGSHEDVCLLEGLIDHEAAHVRYTEFGVGKDDSKLVANLSNILEDVRIERLLGRLYPGVPHNLNEALRIMIERGMFPVDGPTEEASPVALLCAALLFGLRSEELGQRVLQDVGTQYKQALLAAIGPELTQKIWAEAVSGCNSHSTEAVHAAAGRIESLIKEASEPPPEPEPQDQDESDAADDDQSQGSGQGDADDADGSDDDSDAGSDGSSSAASDSEDESADDEQSQGNGQGDADGADASASADGEATAGAGAGSGPGKAEIAKAAQAMLNDLDDAAVESAVAKQTDVGAALKEAMPVAEHPADAYVGQASDLDEQGTGLGKGNQTGLSKQWDVSALDDLASSLVNGLDRRLETLLEAKADNLREVRRSGRLDGRRLSRVAVGGSDVFYRETEGEALNTSVMIVMDMSSSMSTADMQDGAGNRSRETGAAAATYALTRSLGRLDIPYGVMQFNEGSTLVAGVGELNGPVIGLFKDAYGCTKTPDALRMAADLMAERQEEKRLIILIIDGDDDPKAMELVLAETLQRGIQVAGVFIGATGQAMCDLFGSDMVRVTNSADISQALFNALENAVM